MLAYSSIAHAGYVLVGRGGDDARARAGRGASVLFYLLAYTVSTAGAFGALILCGSRGARGGELRGPRRASASATRRRRSRSRSSSSRSRACRRPPASSASGSSSGRRSRAASTGSRSSRFINSVIGAYYYLRVLVYMYMREPAAGRAGRHADALGVRGGRAHRERRPRARPGTRRLRDTSTSPSARPRSAPADGPPSAARVRRRHAALSR